MSAMETFLPHCGDSMSPWLRSGDQCIVSFDEQKAHIGDIILVRLDDEWVTHRVIDRRGEAVIVKGDRNFASDTISQKHFGIVIGHVRHGKEMRWKNRATFLQRYCATISRLSLSPWAKNRITRQVLLGLSNAVYRCFRLFYC